ncbi:MAG: polyprenyl synthetase [Flavobacteriales bacterium]|nr:polyprenyl synthetase [Flavobacteriales bacterium]|tara:strand:+ start:2855 stop:3832 length:978 start_codon:yes stop_codon:yes gene_type:complete
MISRCSNSLQIFFSFSQETITSLSTSRSPQTLYAPINHILSSKGKQIRSVFTLVTYDMFGGNYVDLKPLILAIEGLHNFSLIHDDVMDNAIMRRGVETINTKWSNNQAILSGDVLLIQSYQKLISSSIVSSIILKKFTETAIRICEGQQLDIDFQGRDNVSEEEYLNMIELKTGVLINFSLVAPSLLTDSGQININTINSIGKILGVLFQVQDDFLDLYGKSLTTGKSIGGDIVERKKTFLYVTAYKKASLAQKTDLIRIYNSDVANKIELVRDLYNELGVQKTVEDYIEARRQDLNILINNITVQDEKKSSFKELIKLLLNRNF